MLSGERCYSVVKASRGRCRVVCNGVIIKPCIVIELSGDVMRAKWGGKGGGAGLM